MAPPVDFAVIGAGIVGLATALSLRDRCPRARLLVLDKEPEVGRHQTGHNSGVIHSGVYYRPGSAKARMCACGARLMEAFCERHGIPFERCGKIIAATSPDELPRLHRLHESGTRNGVPGLRLLSGAEVREREPHCQALLALLCPSTGIVDYGAVARRMAALLVEQGVDLRTGAEVRALSRDPGGTSIAITTKAEVLHARLLINCAGLHADTLARRMGLRPEVRIIPFRGEYHLLRPERRALVRGLIYPVPAPGLPFLGVHFTRRVDGTVEAGPNAVLALAREGYTRGTIRPGEVLGMLAYPGFWAMARRNLRVGAFELYRSLSKAAFARSLQRLVPEVRAEDLCPGGAGVRAQAVGRDGALLDDFHIQVADGAIHVLNAPSPAATASLAIGGHIARLAQERLDR